jgi:hypothetical protein
MSYLVCVIKTIGLIFNIQTQNNDNILTINFTLTSLKIQFATYLFVNLLRKSHLVVLLGWIIGCRSIVLFCLAVVCRHIVLIDWRFSTCFELNFGGLLVKRFVLSIFSCIWCRSCVLFDGSLSCINFYRLFGNFWNAAVLLNRRLSCINFYRLFGNFWNAAVLLNRRICLGDLGSAVLFNWCLSFWSVRSTVLFNISFWFKIFTCTVCNEIKFDTMVTLPNWTWVSLFNLLANIFRNSYN